MNAPVSPVLPEPGSVEERALLKRVRERFAAVHPAQWLVAFEAGEMLLLSDEPGHVAPFEIARFTRAATVDDAQLAADAPRAIAFLLALIDRAAERMRGLEARLDVGSAAAGGGKGEGPSRPMARPASGETSSKNHSAEAAIACTKAAFALFLGQRRGVVLATPDAVADALRAELGIASRALLNARTTEGDTARDTWLRLRADFHWWLRDAAGVDAAGIDTAQDEGRAAA